MQNEILVAISDLFTSHDYLVDSLRKADLARFNAIVNRDYAFAVSSLKFLSRLLRDYHGSPCIVLIDEYDAPLECAFNSNSYSDVEKERDMFSNAKAFLGSLFSALLKVIVTSHDSNRFFIIF
jgi:hypothetical protein